MPGSPVTVRADGKDGNDAVWLAPTLDGHEDRLNDGAGVLEDGSRDAQLVRPLFSEFQTTGAEHRQSYLKKIKIWNTVYNADALTSPHES